MLHATLGVKIVVCFCLSFAKVQYNTLMKSSSLSQFGLGDDTIHYKVGEDKKDIHQAGWFLRKTVEIDPGFLCLCCTNFDHSFFNLFNLSFTSPPTLRNNNTKSVECCFNLPDSHKIW